MLRPPRSFADATDMLAIVRWAHERSLPNLTFDGAEANRVICSALQRHGFKSPSATWVQIAENRDGDLTGFLLGALQPVNHCSKELAAVDLWWLAKPECSLRDFVGMMLSFVDFAKAHPRVAEVQSAPDDYSGRGEKAAQALEKIGFTRSGSIYRMQVVSN